MKVTANVHPADGVQSYEDAYEDTAKAMGHDTSKGDPIVFDATDRAFLDAYFDVLHRRLEKDGIDFWWVDWQVCTPKLPQSKTLRSFCLSKVSILRLLVSIRYGCSTTIISSTMLAMALGL